MSLSITVPEVHPVTRHHTKFSTCVLCDGADLELALQLRPSALAESYILNEKLNEVQETFPLDLYLCRSCGHVQLLDAIDPDFLFSNYSYVSSSSPGLAAHFEGYADRLCHTLELQPGSKVLDIGSNDGTLLRAFQSKGMAVLGVDPAKTIAEKATATGIETIPAFFSSSVAKSVRNTNGCCKLITANNVFAHSRNLPDMADGICHLLDKDGVFVFEVSYLPDMIRNMVFDFIYHEHLCYHAARPLETFLRRHGMHLFHAERVPIKGGSLRAYAQRVGGPRPVSESVDGLFRLEDEMGTTKMPVFAEFAKRINLLKDQTHAILDPLKASGKLIAGYGASATVTTLLYHFELGDSISFLVDDNPYRQETYSPGHHIPVLAPEAIQQRNADLVVILAWRFADAILTNHSALFNQGRRVLIPVPRVHVK